MADIAQLAKDLGKAQAEGNLDKVVELATQIHKAKQDYVKSQNEAVRKEAEALAGEREKLATRFHKLIMDSALVAELVTLKATGFTFKLDTEEVKYKSVALLVAGVKTIRAGGTGGGAGKTKDEYGMSLSEVVAKYATPDELTAIANAPSNSAGWQAKMVVKKRVIASGELKPVK